ncbi:MAG: shikimate dehydrogenase family protein, partial [Dehalococcoidia bacterium]
YALLRDGAALVRLHNRTAARADALVASLSDATNRLTAASPDAAQAVQDCDLLVNCTTLGMAHSPPADAAYLAETEIPAGILVCDIVANPPETPLLTRARARGCRTLGGLPMLIRQGAAAFELWTGHEAPLEVMFRAAGAVLRTEDSAVLGPNTPTTRYHGTRH